MKPRKCKLRDGYIVKINGGAFSDRIVSLRSSADGAMKDGLAWYRQACATPGLNPIIQCEPISIIV